MLLVLLPRLATNFSVASSTNMLKKVEPSSTFCNNFFKLARMKFVAGQVEHTVVIRATTRSTRNATMLRDKLNKYVACITGPLNKRAGEEREEREVHIEARGAAECFSYFSSVLKNSQVLT